MLEFTRLSLDEFAIFSERHKYASFLQSKEEYIFKLKEGYDCFLVGVKDNDVIVAATFLYSVPVMKIFSYFYAPRGFLLDYNDENLLSYFLENLKRFLYSKKCLYLKFEPYVPYIERDKSGNIVPNGFNNSKIISNLQISIVQILSLWVYRIALIWFITRFVRGWIIYVRVNMYLFFYLYNL